jgi:homoserine kinase type II
MRAPHAYETVQGASPSHLHVSCRLAYTLARAPAKLNWHFFFLSFLRLLHPAAMAATSTCPVVTDATDASPQELYEAASHFFPADGYSFRRCSGGVNNKTFYAERAGSPTLVVRIYNNGKNLPRVRYEHAVVAALQPLSFSFQVPHFLPRQGSSETFATLSSGGQACCARLIEGGPASGLESARAIGLATAELLRGLKGVSIGADVPPANPLYRNFYSAHHSITREAFMACAKGDAQFSGVRAAMDFLVSEIEATEALIARIVAMDPPLPTQLINADLHTDNVLVEGSKVSGVLDFEFCAVDWRAMELVVGVSKYCGAKDPKPLLSEYIAGYREGEGELTAAEVALIPELIILRILNNVVFFVGRYLAKEDSIEPIAGVSFPLSFLTRACPFRWCRQLTRPPFLTFHFFISKRGRKFMPLECGG